MSDSEEESNLPTAAECQKAIDLFVQVTSTDEALAQSFLQVKIGLSLPHGQERSGGPRGQSPLFRELSNNIRLG